MTPKPIYYVTMRTQLQQFEWIHYLNIKNGYSQWVHIPVFQKALWKIERDSPTSLWSRNNIFQAVGRREHKHVDFSSKAAQYKQNLLLITTTKHVHSLCKQNN